MTSPTNIVAGNWKMNTNVASGIHLASTVAAGASALSGVRTIVAPPFVSLAAVRDAVAGSGVAVAAQNMHADDSGAFTGEVAPPMLVGLCDYVIIGHSERRQFFGETDESVGRKAAAALQHGLRPIVCVGETLDQRESGQAAEVIRRQVVAALADVEPESAAGFLSIAYEPVWAIGTGARGHARDRGSDHGRRDHLNGRGRAGGRRRFGNSTPVWRQREPGQRRRLCRGAQHPRRSRGRRELGRRYVPGCGRRVL